MIKKITQSILNLSSVDTIDSASPIFTITGIYYILSNINCKLIKQIIHAILRIISVYAITYLHPHSVYIRYFHVCCVVYYSVKAQNNSTVYL